MKCLNAFFSILCILAVAVGALIWLGIYNVAANVPQWGITLRFIGSKSSEPGNDEKGAKEIYDKLENIILSMYYQGRERWMDILRHSIAFNAAFFYTQRMV